VVVAFFTGNDFRNNSKFLNHEQVGFYYVFDDHHNLVLDRSVVDVYENNLSYPKRLFQELKTKSHLLTLISQRVYLFRRQLLEMRFREVHGYVKNAGEEKANSLDLFAELNIYRTDLPPPWKEAVEVTKEIILSFKKAVEKRGSRFLLLTLSNAEQVHPELGREWKNRYKVELDYDQPDRILDEFATRNNVVLLKLMPAFREHHLKTGQYLHGFESDHDGHWNQAGHRLAAELTFQFLLQHNMIPIEGETS
jgi:hypothetical protein